MVNIRICSASATVLLAASLVAACDEGWWNGGSSVGASDGGASSAAEAPVDEGTPAAPVNEGAAAESSAAPLAPVDTEGHGLKDVDTEYIGGVLEATHEVLAQPHLVRDLSAVLTGTALEDVENQRRELHDSGSHLEGTATVLSAQVRPTEEPGTLITDACVDQSRVTTVDESGHVVPAAPGEERTAMVLTFAQEGSDGEAPGAWKLAKLAFPDDPHC